MAFLAKTVCTWEKSPWTATTCHGAPRARRCDFSTERMSAKSGGRGRGKGRGRGRGRRGEGTRRRTGEEDEASPEYIPTRSRATGPRVQPKPRTFKRSQVQDFSPHCRADSGVQSNRGLNQR